MAKRVASLYAELGLKADKFKREAAKTKKDLGDLAGNFGNLGSVAQVALAGGVVTGAVAAGKAIYEMGKQGAVVAQTGESFEFMARKVDLADDILIQLRRASRGTIDDMTLMSSTTTLLAGASDELAKRLGDATPRLLEIAKAANKLNPSLGDTAFLYESIATGIKRASPLILDNLGLTISIGQANEKYAAQLGKSVKELTEEEKKVALLNATLEAGNNLIQQVGGNVDSMGDAFARNQVLIKNLTDEMAEKTAPAIGRVAEKANELIPKLLDWLEVMPEAWEELQKGRISAEEYDVAIGLAAYGTEGMAQAQDYLALKVAQYNERMAAANEVTDGWQAGLRDLRVDVENVGESVEEAAVKMSDFSDEFGDIDLSVRGPIGAQIEEFKKEQEELAIKAQDVQNEINELNSLDYLSDKQKDQLQTAKKELDEINKNIAESIRLNEEAQKRLVFDILTDQIRAMEDIDPQLAVRATGAIAEQLGLVDDETVRVMGGLSDAITQLADDRNIYRFGQNVEDVIDDIGTQTDKGKEQIQSLRDEMLELEGEYRVDIVINQKGSVPDVVAPKSKPTRQPRQHGGPVGMNMPYLVGENGPELFIPNTSGQIAPNQFLGSDTIIINNYTAGAAALSNALVEERRRARLNASMTR